VPVPFVLQPAEGVALFELAQTKLSSGEVAEGRAGTDLLFLDETGLFFCSAVLLGNIQVALEMFSEALQVFIQVYGPLHSDIANCYRYAACNK